MHDKRIQLIVTQNEKDMKINWNTIKNTFISNGRFCTKLSDALTFVS